MIHSTKEPGVGATFQSFANLELFTLGYCFSGTSKRLISKAVIV